MQETKPNHPLTSGKPREATGDPNGNTSPQKRLVVCPFELWVRITRELAGTARYIVTEGREHLSESGVLLKDLIDAEREGRVFSRVVDEYGQVMGGGAK